MSAVADVIVIDDIEGASEEGRFKDQGVQAQSAKGSLMENWYSTRRTRSLFSPTTRFIPVSLANQHSKPSYSGDFAQIGGMGH